MLRAELRGKSSDARITYCAKLRGRPTHDIEHRMTARNLRCTDRRIAALRVEADELEREITELVTSTHPELLALPGVGAISAAQVLISWSHPGRFRSEAAFASFSGAAPIPASCGLANRRLLNRSGDRQLNRAMHTIALTRARIDPGTRTYLARRTSEGKTMRDEAKRCLKRISRVSSSGSWNINMTLLASSARGWGWCHCGSGPVLPRQPVCGERPVHLDRRHERSVRSVHPM
ncbi:transposase [Saccharopolyspora pogona]|uniref:transposase n=1 Tax=Saccharopolyspora pogona TaxID=333966 RepID=UPI001685D746|nr:transposase [Saccharopolyspora pogona]